jgi:hypothetical protein
MPFAMLKTKTEYDSFSQVGKRPVPKARLISPSINRAFFAFYERRGFMPRKNKRKVELHSHGPSIFDGLFKAKCYGCAFAGKRFICQTSDGKCLISTPGNDGNTNNVDGKDFAQRGVKAGNAAIER